MRHWIKRKAGYVLGRILAVFFGTLCIVSAGITLYANKIGVYENHLESLIEKGQENLLSEYSKRIYSQFEKTGKADCMEHSNMKYALLQGRRFERGVGLQHIYANLDSGRESMRDYIATTDFAHSERFCTGKDYSTWGGLLHTTLESGVTGDGSEKLAPSVRKREEQVLSLYYSIRDNILYFEVELELYPITTIEVENQIYSRRFRKKHGMSDKGRSVYKLYYDEHGQASYRMWGNLNEELIMDFYKWNQFYANGVLCVGESIYVVDWREKPSRCRSGKEDDIADHYSVKVLGGGTGAAFKGGGSNLRLYYGENERPATDYYWVVSYVDDDLDGEAGDLFAQQKVFLSLLYHLRFALPAIALVSGCLALALSFFVCKRCYLGMEGKNPQGRVHRILLLFYLGFFGGLLSVIFAHGYSVFQNIWSMEENLPREILLFCWLAACIAIGLFLLLTACGEIAYRMGAKILFETSFFGRLLGRCLKIRDFLRANVSFVAMFAGGAVFLSIIEGLLYWWGSSVGANPEWVLLLIRGMEIILLFRLLYQLKALQERAKGMAGGDLETRLDTSGMAWQFKKHGDYLNRINDGMVVAVEEKLKSERLKTELITNMSHDIKTPLTSIINYVDLLKKKDASDEEKAEYLEVLDRQSARLKKMIEDLMEASKAATGNLKVNLELCDIGILLTQAMGEYEERMAAAGLQMVAGTPGEGVCVMADNRYLWRIFDNLLGNISKYSQPGTRVYIDVAEEGEDVQIVFRNISRDALNVSSEELMQRFVRGDSSRSTEGSGLGLSIAESLAGIMGGTLEIYLDGDLFKATVVFPKAAQSDNETD